MDDMNKLWATTILAGIVILVIFVIILAKTNDRSYLSGYRNGKCQQQCIQVGFKDGSITEKENACVCYTLIQETLGD